MELDIGKDKHGEDTRMIDEWAVLETVRFGYLEVAFCENLDHKDPYMVTYVEHAMGLIERYNESVVGTNYLEMYQEYHKRVGVQLEKAIEKQKEITAPLDMITADQCTPINYSQNIEGKVVVINPEAMGGAYRIGPCQLVLATGGFGTHGNSRGTAVYTKELYSGKEERFNRDSIMGIIEPERLPDWAKPKYQEIMKAKAEKKRDDGAR